MCWTEQLKLDKRIALWKERYRHPITGKEAVREFEEFVHFGSEQISIAEVLNTRFTPEKVHLFGSALGWMRRRQLAGGESLNANEKVLWQSIAARTAMDAKCITAFKLRASDGTEVWFAITMNGFHLRSTVQDATGPFWTVEDMVQYLATNVKAWHGWCQPTSRSEQGYALCWRIEQASGIHREPSGSQAA